jgi:hypothetical protein
MEVVFSVDSKVHWFESSYGHKITRYWLKRCTTKHTAHRIIYR